MLNKNQEDSLVDDHGYLKSCVEDFLTRTADPRLLSMKCRDYYDGKQWTAEQIADLKEKLYEHLKLVPVRDSITFEKKAFAASAPEKSYTIYYFISALVLVGFVGLFTALKVSGPKTSVSAEVPCI